MKKNYLCTYALVLLMTGTTAYGQQKQVPIGKTADVVQELRQQAGARSGTHAHLSLKVAANKTLSAKVNFRQSAGAGVEQLAGEIENVPGSSFYLRAEGNTFVGNIILKNTQQAYQYHADAAGTVYVEEVPVDKVVCVNLEKAPSQAAATRAQAALAVPYTELQSLPGANGCVLLDFDGQYVSGTPWNSGNPIDAAPATLTPAQIVEAWELVSEDYKPFNINITTNEAVFNTYPKNRRMRCIITPTNTAASGSGGVAYIGSFNWNDDTPCWVFNMGAKSAGDAASHEVGHCFGLGHDGRTTPSEGYYLGQGNWAPIMGAAYYKNVGQWSKGEYANANNTEDDLAKITSTTYGVGYRADDFGGTVATASPIVTDSAGNIAASNAGFIGRTGDVDFFSFTTSGGMVTINFNTVPRHANLDILATLYNSTGTALGTYNPTALSATVSASLAAGTYYVSVTGTGSGNPATDGYSNYGSLGAYSISGIIPPAVTTPAVATLYQHCSTTSRYAIGLSPGNYTTAALVARGIGNNDVSMLTVQSGYEVVLYKEDNFTGASISFTSDVTCLTTYGFNDSTTSVRVRSVSNQLPVVSVATPVAGSIAVAPATFVISAIASDADGGIAKVEFFNGSVKLGESVSAPFNYTWPNVTAGNYTINVVATDDRGGQTTATVPVSVIVSGATFYKDCDYNGTATDLEAGNYTLSQLNAKGILNNDLSSLKVKSGYEVVLYQNDNFGGSSYTFTGNIPCLVTAPNGSGTVNLNDWTSSLIVRTTAAAPVVTVEPALLPTATALLVGPNPFVDYVTIRFDGVTTMGSVKVFDINGALLQSFPQVKNGQRINLAGLRAGIYLVKIDTGSASITRKLVKQ